VVRVCLLFLPLCGGTKSITAIDTDIWSYENTIENVELNGIENVKVIEGGVEFVVSTDNFDIILANINKNILIRDMKFYANALLKGGYIYFSGYYANDLLDIETEANKNSLKFVSNLEKNSWVAAVFEKEGLIECQNTLHFFFAFILLNINGIYAQQPDSLSTNSEEFYQQISQILLNTTSKTYQKKSEVLLGRFYARWSIGRFNKDEKTEVRNLVEKMRTKNMRTYPYLYDYLYALTLISESQQLPKSVISWHAYALKLLK